MTLISNMQSLFQEQGERKVEVTSFRVTHGHVRNLCF